MNELFWVFVVFGIGSVIVVSVQAVALVFLTKWNAELRREVELNKPPF